MIFKTRGNLFIVLVNLYRRVVLREEWIDGSDEGTNSFPLFSVMIGVVSNHHPPLLQKERKKFKFKGPLVGTL